MADDRIEIEVLLDDGSVQKGFANVKKEGQKAGKFLSSSFAKVGATIAGIGAAFATAFAAREVVQAAQIQEDAINQLNTSLKTAGSFSDEASQSLQEFASNLQLVTTVGDEVILNQLALARNFTQTNEEARALVEAAVDLSAATGLTLDSAVTNLGKTFAGLTGELGESVPALRSLTAEQLKAGAAIELISQRFGGAAAAQTQTFSGRISQLSNLFGDLQEVVGSLITQSPALVNAFGFIATKISEATSSLSEFSQDRDIVGSLLNQLISFGLGVNQFVLAPLEILNNVVAAVFSGLRAQIQGGVLALATAAQTIVSIFSPESELAQNLTIFQQNASGLFNQFGNDARNAVGNIFNTDTTESFEVFLENFKAQINRVREEGLKPLQKEFTKTTEGISDDSKKASFNVNQGIGAGIGRAVQTSVQALAAGENAFSAFAGALLSVFGDLAIQIGQFFIINGLAVESLKAIKGAAAIAAGIALIALGTLLKGASGGSPGLTTPAGSPAGDAGFVGGGFVDEGVDETEDIEDQRTSQVAINIQGDVFDSEDTGLRIANILQNEFDTAGTRLVTA